MEMAKIAAPPLPPCTSRKRDPLISIVVPCFNESETVELFIDAVDTALQNRRLEYIFVNDGSGDDTLAKLLALSVSDDRIVIVNLSRNFGKEVAMTAGIDAATGDVVVPMDSDLQDPPEVIANFLERWREGFDVVYGIRRDRSSDTLLKRQTAGLFYRFFNHLAQTEIPRDVGDFRLMDRVVVNALKKLPERTRFMKGLFSWVGFPSVGVEYTRAPRVAGATKFNYWRLWNFALEGLVSFSTLPLRIWTYAGLLVACSSVIYAVVIVIRTMIFGRDVPGYASIMTALLFLGGVQLMSLGVIGEYMSRLFLESKQRPLYLLQGIYREGRSVEDT
jgi:glycosyltransferase involved in cell wall biosynthesis